MKNRALLLIDFQKASKVRRSNCTVYQQCWIKSISVLLSTANTMRPLFLFNMKKPNYLLAQTLGNFLKSWIHNPQIFHPKTHANAFYQTNLNDLLTEQAVQTLEIAGVQTEFCVDTTIRMAHGLGYTCLMTPKTTSTLDNGHLTAAQIIQHHEAIWAGRF